MSEGRIPTSHTLILVVDDEDVIVRMATAILSTGGYRAVVAANGEEGLRKYQEHRQEIGLVLTDIVMPECGGLEMAQKIREIDPAVKILFMSGYTNALQEVRARRKFPFIRKPFLPADLLRKIAEVLRDGGDMDAGVGQR